MEGAARASTLGRVKFQDGMRTKTTRKKRHMTFLVLVYFVVINLAGFLGLVIPTIINEGGDSDESMQPFSANWTVNFDVDGCWVHPVGGVNEEIFYNVSEAENACLEFGPKICAGQKVAHPQNRTDIKKYEGFS